MTALQTAASLLPLVLAAVAAGNFERFGDFGGEQGLALIPDLDGQFDSSARFSGRAPAGSPLLVYGGPGAAAGLVELPAPLAVFPAAVSAAPAASAAAVAPERRPVAPAPRRPPAASPLGARYYPVTQAVETQQPRQVFRAAPSPRAYQRPPPPVFQAQPAAPHAYRGSPVPAPAPAPVRAQGRGPAVSYQVQHDRPTAGPPRARLSGAYAPTASAAAAAPAHGFVSRDPAKDSGDFRARYRDDDLSGFSDFGGHGFGFGADDSF